MKILRVDMSAEEIRYETLPEEYELYGGRGLIARLLNEEVNPKCDPLGSENKLIFCHGLLAGTAAPSSGRLSIGAKSPLTGTIKEANAGGIAGQMLARLGLKAIIIENQPKEKKMFILKIDGDGAANLVPANDYIGMSNYSLVSKLRNTFGERIGVISIGPAGEFGYKNSSIQITDLEGRPSRAAARGGLGAVMGAKGLKAVVLEPVTSAEIPYENKEIFLNAARNYIQGVKKHPVSGKAMSEWGTAVLVNVVNEMGALPTRNFSRGSFEAAEEISGENLAKIQSQRGGKTGHICQNGCPIGCSNVYLDEKGNYLTSGLEYETIALNGANCGIASLDTIARIDRLCDDFGLDTIETGATLAVCMEAGKIGFGDEEGALSLIQEMINCTDFGKILGQGTAFTAQKLGVKRIPTVKGQAIAGYDPRALKGTGVTYATSPMGADHTAGNSLSEKSVDPQQKEGQTQVSANLQILMATFDSLGLCIFAGFCAEEPENMNYLLQMMEGKFGGRWTLEKLLEIGIRTLTLEKTFNEKAGFTSLDDRLPDFMRVEPLPPSNCIFDIPPEEIDSTFSFISKKSERS